jgi:hypothetical protein
MTYNLMRYLQLTKRREGAPAAALMGGEAAKKSRLAKHIAGNSILIRPNSAFSTSHFSDY